MTMVRIPGITPIKLQYFSYHKSLGVSVFLLGVLRLWWRLRHPAPRLPAVIAPVERRLAAATHGLLYLLIFAVPASGYFYSLAAGVPVIYLGIIPLPIVIEPNPSLKPMLKALHFWLNTGLAACLALHIAGTLKHRLVDKEDLLQRMLP
jgi:cytochrome b561